MFKFIKNIFKKNPRLKGRLYAIGIISSMGENDRNQLKEARPEILEYMEKFLNPKEPLFTENFDDISIFSKMVSDRMESVGSLFLTVFIDSIIKEATKYGGNDARQFVMGVKEILILV